MRRLFRALSGLMALITFGLIVSVFVLLAVGVFDTEPLTEPVRVSDFWILSFILAVAAGVSAFVSYGLALASESVGS